MRPVPSLRASITILFDAVGVCLLAAFLLAGVEIVRNEYVQLGYVHHLLYAPADRFRELLPPTLGMFAAMALVAFAAGRWHRQSPRRAVVLATVSGASILGLLVYRRALFHAVVANLPEGAARMSAGWYRVLTGLGFGGWLLLAAVTLGIVTLRMASARSGSSQKSFA